MVCVGPRTLCRPMERRTLDPQDGSIDKTAVLLLRGGAGVLLQLSLRPLQDPDTVPLPICPKTDILWPEADFDPISLPHFPETHLHLAHSYPPLVSSCCLAASAPSQDRGTIPVRPDIPTSHVILEHIPSLYRSHPHPASLGFPPTQHPRSTPYTEFAHTDRSGSRVPKPYSCSQQAQNETPKTGTGPTHLLSDLIPI